MADGMHAGLAAYLGRSGMVGGESREDGALVLVIDGLHRIVCRPARGGALVLEGRVASLPAPAARADSILSEAMRRAAARLSGHRESLVLSEDEGTLLLQEWLDAEAGMAEFESTLEHFINALVYWQRVLSML